MVIIINNSPAPGFEALPMTPSSWDLCCESLQDLFWIIIETAIYVFKCLFGSCMDSREAYHAEFTIYSIEGSTHDGQRRSIAMISSARELGACGRIQELFNEICREAVRYLPEGACRARIHTIQLIDSTRVSRETSELELHLFLQRGGMYSASSMSTYQSCMTESGAAMDFKQWVREAVQDRDLLEGRDPFKRGRLIEFNLQRSQQEMIRPFLPTP